MKRENFRKLLIIISMLLFPVVMWYLSPYVIIDGALNGVITGSFITFTFMLIGSVFWVDCFVVIFVLLQKYKNAQ